MPNYIIVLGESRTLQTALVKSYITRVQGHQYEDWHYDATHVSSKELIVPGSNYFTGTTFEIVETNSSSPDLVEDITAWRDSVAVIYAIPHQREEESTAAFTARVQAEYSRLAARDRSRPHVKKYLVLVEEKLPAERRSSDVLTELKIFALTHHLRLLEVQTNSNDHSSLQAVFNNIHKAIKKSPNIVSRFLGAFCTAVLGSLTFIILANPLARFFNEWHHGRWDTDKHAGKSIIRIVFSPLLSIIYDLKVIPGYIQYGWQNGFIEGLTSPLSISSSFSYDEYDYFYHMENDDDEDQYNDNFAFNLAPRNIIASLIIIGLIAVTVLAALNFFGPLVFLGWGITAFIVKGIGLTLSTLGVISSSTAAIAGIIAGLSPPAIAAIAGTIVGVGASILYGVGYGLYKALKNYLYPRRIPRNKRPNDYSLEIRSDEPNIISRVLGAFFSFVLGGLATIVLLNPLAHFYIAWQKSKWHSFSDIGFSLLSIIGFPFLFIGINTPRIINLTKEGWKNGFVSGITSFLTVAESLLESSYSRNILVSLGVGGLVLSAVLVTAGAFGPLVVGGVGLTSLAVNGMATFAGTLGITGISGAALVAFAGIAVGVVGSLLYGAVYGAAKLLKYGSSSNGNAATRGTDNPAHGPIDFYSSDASSFVRAQLPVKVVAPASNVAAARARADALSPAGTSPGNSFLHPSPQQIHSSSPLSQALASFPSAVPGATGSS